MILSFNRTQYDNMECDELDGASGTPCIFIQKKACITGHHGEAVAQLLEALR